MENYVYAIAVFGVLMMALSTVMVINPGYWSDVIVRFSRQKYFHAFEILSRLSFGAIFIVFAEQTLYPVVMGVLGYLMMAVGVVLLIMPSRKHKEFAVWSAKKFRNAFRPAGFGSMAFGAFIVYGAIHGP